MMAYGSRLYGLGVMALGLCGLAWRDFDLGQPVPTSFPQRVALAYVAGAFMVVAGAEIDAPLRARLTRVGQRAFGICAILFGGAHFIYLNFTIPFVPKWLPDPTFWAYSTGIAHIAAGVAILTGMHALLAAILLTLMYASFTPLVHLPMLLGDPSSRANWSENALNLALIGVAWVVADSTAGRSR